MPTVLTPAQRLIVAADFKPDPAKGEGRVWVRGKILALADALADMGVVLKVNSGLRALGYDLIDEIHLRGLQVFADLKLKDIGNTLENDGLFLVEAKPEIVTVCCDTGYAGIDTLVHELPDAEVLGITVLTTFKPKDGKEVYNEPDLRAAAFRLAEVGMNAGLDGLVCAPAEVTELRLAVGEDASLVTPNVRFASQTVVGDDQNKDRSMTPGQAIAAGATRIVMGRPIIQAPDQREAAMRAVEEIAAAA